ncbi:MAG: hypothetical protein JSS64_15100 [Bacteroidetes bacterium]|nr:hypothetical protein [Bacteroidota bacterium]
MKPIIKLYLKAFVLIAISSFGVMILLSLSDFSKKIILKDIITSLFFGLFMSLILVSYHLYRIKKNGIKIITDDNIGVNQTLTIETKLCLNEVIQKIKIDPNFGKMKMKVVENGIILETRTTMKSWGEAIKIIMNSNKENLFKYQVSSSPKLKTTIVDYGKNLENINKIENLIITHPNNL